MRIRACCPPIWRWWCAGRAPAAGSAAVGGALAATAAMAPRLSGGVRAVRAAHRLGGGDRAALPALRHCGDRHRAGRAGCLAALARVADSGSRPSAGGGRRRRGSGRCSATAWAMRLRRCGAPSARFWRSPGRRCAVGSTWWRRLSSAYAAGFGAAGRGAGDRGGAGQLGPDRSDAPDHAATPTGSAVHCWWPSGSTSATTALRNPAVRAQRRSGRSGAGRGRPAAGHARRVGASAGGLAVAGGAGPDRPGCAGAYPPTQSLTMRCRCSPGLVG